MNARALVGYGASTVLALVRRRFTLAILVLLPLCFYAASHDTVGRSVRSLVFGVSWALSTLAYFATVGAREVEPRLVLVGWSRRRLVGARLSALVVFGLVLAAALWAVVALDQPVRSLPGVACDFGVTAVVAVAVGAAVGALVRAELQGVLVLFVFAGLQAVVNPFDGWTRVLPFWSSRELGTWAVDGPLAGSLGAGLVHAAAVSAVAALVVVVAERRSGPRPPVPLDERRDLQR